MFLARDAKATEEDICKMVSEVTREFLDAKPLARYLPLLVERFANNVTKSELMRLECTIKKALLAGYASYIDFVLYDYKQTACSIHQLIHAINSVTEIAGLTKHKNVQSMTQDEVEINSYETLKFAYDSYISAKRRAHYLISRLVNTDNVSMLMDVMRTMDAAFDSDIIEISKRTMKKSEIEARNADIARLTQFTYDLFSLRKEYSLYKTKNMGTFGTGKVSVLKELILDSIENNQLELLKSPYCLQNASKIIQQQCDYLLEQKRIVSAGRFRTGRLGLMIEDMVAKHTVSENLLVKEKFLKIR